jgi:hypothetical protein
MPLQTIFTSQNPGINNSKILAVWASWEAVTVASRNLGSWNSTVKKFWKLCKFIKETFYITYSSLNGSMNDSSYLDFTHKRHLLDANSWTIAALYGNRLMYVLKEINIKIIISGGMLQVSKQ